MGLASFYVVEGKSQNMNLTIPYIYIVLESDNKGDFDEPFAMESCGFP